MTFLASIAAVALIASPVDPRIELVELQRSGDFRSALTRVESLRAADPSTARRLGLELLRGALLEQLGRRPEAAAAFAEAIGADPELAPWARLRLAETQSALGHPEVAAGVAATLLARQPPASLVPRAAEVFFSALRQGGDCRLLAGVGPDLPRDLARRREVAAAECLLRGRSPAAARERLRALLLADARDLAAFDAAELWLDQFDPPSERPALRALGEALAGQRDFAQAVPILEAALAGEPRDGSEAQAETLYLLARSEFWLGRFGRAARTFEEIVRTARSAARQADARHQQARCLELLGDRAGAATLFREAFELDPRGEWAGPALLSRLRLDWLAGRRQEALALLEQIGAERGLRPVLARAALFLVASTLVAGEADPQVGRWLDAAERSGESSLEEIAYWRGRAAELAGRPAEAVRAYVEAQRERPFHPLASAARQRLARAPLSTHAEALGLALARGATLGEMHGAWILLGPIRPEALVARSRALTGLAAAPDVALWIRWSPVPAAAWPLFAGPLDRPEERLLALGQFRDGAAALARQFPAARRDLTFTAAQLLHAQQETGLALRVTESSFEARPRGLRGDWVAPEVRRLLYPLPFRQSLLAQATLRGIDPWLLTAILREESRFRPDAVSPVGARGIAQLTLPTARRLSTALGVAGTPRVSDLHRPEVAIPLAATLLAELGARFDGLDPAIVAAYNAGEAQAELWRSYCLTREPEELLAKIGFRETRAYVSRVLEGRSHYAALYGL